MWCFLLSSVLFWWWWIMYTAWSWPLLVLLKTLPLTSQQLYTVFYHWFFCLSITSHLNNLKWITVSSCFSHTPLWVAQPYCLGMHHFCLALAAKLGLSIRKPQRCLIVCLILLFTAITCFTNMARWPRLHTEDPSNAHGTKSDTVFAIALAPVQAWAERVNQLPCGHISEFCCMSGMSETPGLLTTPAAMSVSQTRQAVCTGFWPGPQHESAKRLPVLYIHCQSCHVVAVLKAMLSVWFDAVASYVDAENIMICTAAFAAIAPTSTYSAQVLLLK